MAKRKLISHDYKDELASIVEEKGFGHEAENLILNMFYKIEESYPNYKVVKRVVPDLEDIEYQIVETTLNGLDNIKVATPRNQLQKYLTTNKLNLYSEDDKVNNKTLLTAPNSKSLIYNISKVAVKPAKKRWGEAAVALYTAINIGKCTAISEIIRDFTGWAWASDEKELESIECNIIFTYLLFLIGPSLFENIDLNVIKTSVTPEFFNELKNACIQFYTSNYLNRNEETFNRIYEDKMDLMKMKKRAPMIAKQIEDRKKVADEIGKYKKILNSAASLKKNFVLYNQKASQAKKIFSVSDYAEQLENQKAKLEKRLAQIDKSGNPNNYFKDLEKLEYEIKFYESKTAITKLTKEFLKAFELKVSKARSKKDILDLLYQVRYLSNLPKWIIKLDDIKEILIPKAIKAEVIQPISNNDLLDYRILKGIFNSQVVLLEKLTIKLTSSDNKIHVEIYDGDMIDQRYDVPVPEGSDVEIRTTRKIKIFE